MAIITGDIKSLKARQKRSIERLGKLHTSSREFISQLGIRELAKAVANLRIFVGIILDREGKVTHVIVGSRSVLYLPDLGRFRLGKNRLRRLRLVVAIPPGKEEIRSERPFTKAGERSDYFLEIPEDFLTDLDKLRLDAVGLCEVRDDGTPGRFTMAHLSPVKASVFTGIEINFYHYSSIHDLDIDAKEFFNDLEQKFRQSSSSNFDTSNDKAILISAYDESIAEAMNSVEELSELARSAGVVVVDSIYQKKSNPRTLIGKGKLEEIILHCLDFGANLLIFDRELTPNQLRAISNLTELKILDRSMLIMDIFAQRSHAGEGKLEVELAQLKYTLPRLREKDSGLSRLSGGIGGRGPGETKLEISRRRARQRIAELEKKIDKLAQQRKLRRGRRKKRGIPVVAIVGYANSGKSTLINAITKSNSQVEELMFATLDTRVKRVKFSNEKEIVFVDTVGFIRELPEELINAFQSTLEEVHQADLIIHLIDASSPHAQQQKEIIINTLEELKCNEIPRILAWNKIDKLSSFELKALQNKETGVFISAAKRKGIEYLIDLTNATFRRLPSAMGLLKN